MTNIILTGGSGFLGSFFRNELIAYNIITLGRNNSNIECDLTGLVPSLPKADLVIHCAGKAHAHPKTIRDEEDFFLQNVNGTRNLLSALEANLPRSFVFISSVAVYGKELGVFISEETALDATDPYGKSKIMAEQIVTEWCLKHQVICTILRLPLIAGPNPPGNLGSMIKGIKIGYYLNIEGGKARKSIVLATDVVNITLRAAVIGGIFNLTDGYHPSFLELSQNIAGQLGKKTPINIPKFLAVVFAFFGDILGNSAPINTKKVRKIMSDLTFDDNHARQLLGWRPKAVLEYFFIK